MVRALPAVVAAVISALVAHLAGLPLLATAALGLLAAGAAEGGRVLRAERGVLRRPDPSITAARRDVAGVVAAAFPVFTAWVVTNLLISPGVLTAVYGPGATSGYSPSLVLVLMVLLAGTGVLVANRAPAVIARMHRPTLVLAAVLLTLFGVKAAIAWGLVKLPAFDSGIMVALAYHAVVPTTTVGPFGTAFSDWYFGMYPNNLPLAQFFSLVAGACAAVGLSGVPAFVAVLLGINCVALTGVELLTFLTVRRLWGTRAAWVALAATALFTTLSPWLGTPYSDTLGMLFPVGLLYGWLRLRAEHGRRRRFVVAAVIGVVAALGIALKPTVVFAVVAILLVEVVRSRRALLRRRTAVTAGALAGLALVAGGLTTAGITAATDSSALTRFDVWTWHGGVPLTHFMKMGAAGTGGFEFQDVQSTLAVPQSERAQAAFRVYLQRVEAMGPEGYAVFLGNKALRTFGDGSFYLGQEGENPHPFSLDSPYSATVRQWYQRDGSDHVALASLWQAAWVLLLACASLPVARFAPPAQRRAIDTTRIAMLALLLFLLLFETRARYVYLYVPYLVVMATGLLSALPAALAAVRTGRWRRAPRRVGTGVAA